jgi:hypothetical protein
LTLQAQPAAAQSTIAALESKVGGFGGDGQDHATAAGGYRSHRLSIFGCESHCRRQVEQRKYGTRRQTIPYADLERPEEGYERAMEQHTGGMESGGRGCPKRGRIGEGKVKQVDSSLVALQTRIFSPHMAGSRMAMQSTMGRSPLPARVVCRRTQIDRG